MTRKLQNWETLLQGIVDGLSEGERERNSIGTVEVTFHCGDHSYTFSLVNALTVIADDLFWDERGDWSSATHATVRTL